MDAELKTKWLAALRSGEYEQTTGMLRRDDTYCCLGVLCDVSERGTWVKRGGAGTTWRWEYELAFDEAPVYLDADLLDGRFDLPADVELDSIELNDDGETFASIADYLEANL